MKKLLSFCVAFSSAAALAAPEVTSLVVRQLWPFSSKLRVEYQITGATGATDLDASVTVDGVTTPVNAEYVDSEIRSVDKPVSGAIIIDAEKQFAGCGSAISATVSLTASDAAARKYMVIDLSSGVDSTSYPVSYLADVPAGGWTDEYKKEKLVLRRVEAGSCGMGANNSQTSLGTDNYKYCPARQVTLTHGYYIGVFEVTQRQWELVVGTHPSQAGIGDTYPLENMTWEDVRGMNLGTNWPYSSEVDASSFIGKMRARTLLRVDLPTAAQWENAAHAGCASQSGLPNGTHATAIDDPALLNYAHIGGGAAVPVGTLAANNWGLYDVLGNVAELCVDRFQTSQTMESQEYGNFRQDPVGPGNSYTRTNWGGIYRVTRGGGFADTDYRRVSLYYNNYTFDILSGGSKSRSTSIGLRLVVNFAVYPGE